MNYLQDSVFLEQLYTQKNQTKYVKLVVFNKHGLPQEILQGKCLNGSVNIDGKSAIRRTCSLTLMAEHQEQFNAASWGLSNEFELYVGLLNYSNPTYPDIIWFPLGHYLIASFSCVINKDGYNISISGKDKMSQLNGEFGGIFTNLSTNISSVELVDETGNIIETNQLTLKEMITNILITYGLIPYHLIIINDLDMSGRELLEYRGSEPLYILLSSMDDDKNRFAYKILTDVSQVVYVGNALTPSRLDNDKLIQYITVNNILDENDTASIVRITNNLSEPAYQILKIQTGDTAGYRNIPLIYPGELIMNLNETVVNALDKIVNVLGGAYEYYFDYDGSFIFKRKTSSKLIQSSSFSLGETSEILSLVNSALAQVSFDYSLQGVKELTQVNSTAAIANIKNDFSIWGKKNDVPLHLRYAIHNKPKYYKTYHYTPSDDELASNPRLVARPSKEYKTYGSGSVYDWRELIYQMAYDYAHYGQRSDFVRQLITNNAAEGLYSEGKTGYEQYYTDMLSFWRDIYNPQPSPEYSLFNPSKINDSNQSTIYTNKYDILGPDQNNRIQLSDEQDRKLIYCMYQDQLQRWIDTVDLTALANSSGFEHMTLDNMYYYKNKTPVKIIDSLEEFNKDEIFYILQTNGEYVPYYETLTDDIKLYTYITESRSSRNYKKLIDFFSVLTYERENIKPDEYGTQFYVQFADDAVPSPITEIWLSLFQNTLHKQEVCLWSYNNITPQPLTETVINIIVEALKNYTLDISLKVPGKDIAKYNIGDKILIAAERAIGPENGLYIKTNEMEQYSLLSTFLLNYGTGEKDNPLYNKYTIFYQKTINQIPKMISAVELVNLDKGNIYLKQEYSNNNLFTPIIDLIELPLYDDDNIYYYKSEEKINIFNNITEINGYPNNFIKLYYIPGTTKLNDLMKKNILTLSAKPMQYGGILKSQEKIKYYKQYYDFNLESNNDYTQCWNHEILNNFNETVFWIDFLDMNHEICQYAQDIIGYRPLVINNNMANGITFQNNQLVRFIAADDQDSALTKNEIIIPLSDAMKALFVTSAQTLSCVDLLNECLIKNLNIANTLNCTCTPIYHLDANKILFFNDDNKIINNSGIYDIQRITIPLSYNGLMQLTMNKIII